MKERNVFLRSVLMSSVLLLCFCIIYLGIFFAYEGIRKNGFGEEVSAVEINGEYIRFLDYTVNITKE